MLLIHDNTNDLETNQKFADREERWIYYAKGWFDNFNHDWNLEDILHILYDLQLYLAFDYPKVKTIPYKNTFEISDNLARISMWFAKNNHELTYPIEKLSRIFIALFDDHINLDDD